MRDDNISKEWRLNTLNHAMERYSERYSKKITAKQHRYLSDKCAKQDAINIGSIDRFAKVKIIVYKGSPMPVLYDTRLHMIATFFPPNGVTLYDYIYRKRNGK